MCNSRDMALFFGSMAIKVCGVTGRSYTYARLRDMSAAIASRLITVLKLQPCDTVALVSPNVPEFPAVVMGGVEAGTIITTVNPLYTAEEISRQFINSGSKCVFASDESVSVVIEAVKSLPEPIPIIVISTEGKPCPQGCIKFSEFSDTKNADFSVLDKALELSKPNDVCMMPYSSGTTGLPKGVELTHNNIASNCEMLKAGEVPLVTPASGRYLIHNLQLCTYASDKNGKKYNLTDF
ncbi:4-coumarate--CoA ligase 1-like [Ctenocephalides felis]|uniref:4-coumarate--CoA ligase 1-like n=1 Tax=Ctenocephalides felis TaxID=7515 RepID=UPI000E6E36B2|nr:4-coumarate--CoA ligase 1-like [Ctenocephalides felis]